MIKIEYQIMVQVEGQEVVNARIEEGLLLFHQGHTEKLIKMENVKTCPCFL